MNTLFGSSRYSPNGAHSTNPRRAYKARAGAKYAHDPVSRLSRDIPCARAAAMICRSIADPTPRPRAVSAVCMDFTSP